VKVDAIKLVAAAKLAGIDATDQEEREAVGEAVDLVLGFFSDVRRIADAATTIASVADAVVSGGYLDVRTVEA